MDNRSPDPELCLVAHHEAGHAVAIVQAFRNAKWLPRPPPQWPATRITITEDAPGKYSGMCYGHRIYETGRDPLEPRLMEAQITIDLAGGIAEAIHRGEQRPRKVLRKAEGMAGDIERITEVIAELRRLTGRRSKVQDFVEPTLTLLLAQWPNVTALAHALVQGDRIFNEPPYSRVLSLSCLPE
jgi:hypothetical protein